jgi:carbon starvation protein
LLASLGLLAVSVWLKKTGRNFWYTLVPMVFMLVMTVWSLVLQVQPGVVQLVGWIGWHRRPQMSPMMTGGVGALLLVLTVMLLFEAARILRERPPARV